MKARVPSIKRSCKVPLASGVPGLPLARHKVLFSGRTCLPRSRPCDACLFSSTAEVNRISLADRIKQFFPADATEENAAYENDILVELPKSSLAAFETEISTVVGFVEELKFHKAHDYLLASLPFQAMLTALTDRIVPVLQKGPLGVLGVTEFAYILFSRGNGALASQMLTGMNSADNSMASNSLSELELFEPLQLISNVDKQASTAIQVDVLIQSVGGASEFSKLHFPQLLSYASVSPWLKAHLMAQLDPHELRRWLLRYASHFPPHAISLLTTLASPQQFDVIANWIVDEKRLSYVPAVLLVLSEATQFHQICRPLLRRAANTPLPDDLARDLLRHALRLKQSYDIANICKRCASAFKYPEHITLMAKALLAAAFAQRKPANSANAGSNLVFESGRELHSFLVNRVLTPVAHDTAARNAVIGLAAARLLNTHTREIPGKVLWKLLLSLPGPLGGSANTALARLVVKRPYIEQARYMALPTVTANGVRELLKWHILKIMEHRRMYGVKPSLPQAKEDIQLLVAGLLLASEKGGLRDVRAADAGARYAEEEVVEHSHHDNPVASVFTELFENGAKEETLETAHTAIESVTEEHYDRELSASIAFYVIAELVRQKSYTVARQLFKTVGPHRFPSATAQTLLLNLAQDQPEDSYRFVLWLTRLNANLARPRTVNKMMTILTGSPDLSESQLTNRFQSLRHLLRTQLNSSVEQEPAISLVDALIRSAVNRQGGSLQRLQWALGVAKQAGVPDTKFADWSVQLDNMRSSKQGYWCSSE